jgi:ATP-dependent DNA ligase
MLRPMLATTIDAADLDRVIHSDDWCGQLKADGVRCVVQVTDAGVTFTGRDGQPSSVASPIRRQCERAPVGWTFDGEALVGGRLVLFDLVHPAPFADRHEVLTRLVAEVWRPRPSVVNVLPCWRGAAAKTALVDRARAASAEGVIWRRLDSGYVERRSGDLAHGGPLLRHKFTADIDVVVVELGRRTRRSDRHAPNNVGVAVLDPWDGPTGRVVDLGTVSAAGAWPRPQLGDVWSTRIGGWYPQPGGCDPRLWHPRLIRRRTEKAPGECLLDQLGPPLNRTPKLTRHGTPKQETRRAS